jgi:hypothetical protein
MAFKFNNFKFLYIDHVLSLSYNFGDFVDHIYPTELEITDTTDTARSASYLDLHFKIDSEGWLRTKFYDKRDDFNFPLGSFHLCVATFKQHLHMVDIYIYISQLIRYSRTFGSYQDLLDRWLLITRKLLNQWFILTKLKSSLRMCYGRHHDSVNPLRNICVRNAHGYVPFVVLPDPFPNHGISTGFVVELHDGVTNGAWTAYPSGAHEFTPGV